MSVNDLGVEIVAGIRTWTGRESRELRLAYRLSVRNFAAFLGVGARTVAAWEATPGITPRPHMQAILDTALERAPADVKERFAARIGHTVPADAADLSRALSHGRGADRDAVAVQDPFPTDGYETEDRDVQRRLFVQGLAALGMAAPLAGLENLRHDLVGMVGGEPASLSEWEAISWDYAHSYSTTPPAQLFADLTADLFVARNQLTRLQGIPKRDLQRVIARLGVFMAQTMGNLGNTRTGYRWWRFARQTADSSGDTEVRVWVRGREVVRSLYEHRPLGWILDLSDETLAISDAPSSGVCEALTGRAQTLALLGHESGARQSLAQAQATISRLPAQISGDTTSVYGWPEYRLRHTESFVYTHLDDPEAANAQEQALALYPAQRFRARAQVELHQAMRLVRSGDTGSGIDHAHQVLEALPDKHRIEVVLEVARSVVKAVPAAQQHHSGVGDLRQMLALPAVLTPR
jgi:DNA-binding transcriptional regulator YiaG